MKFENEKPAVASRAHDGRCLTLLRLRRKPAAELLIALEPELGHLFPADALEAHAKAFAQNLLTSARLRRLEED